MVIAVGAGTLAEHFPTVHIDHIWGISFVIAVWALDLGPHAHGFGSTA
jgi:hypothetical protein